ncbi:alanine dehydrogenase [Chloroflexota bacterium]
MQNYISNSDSTDNIMFLSKQAVHELLGMSEALKAAESAFKLSAEGKAIMPSKLYLDLPDYHGDFRAMPAYIDGMAGLKWVCVYPDNRKLNLPSVMATIILCDPSTGCPLAIMDGTYITNMRTGASGGISVKYLARKNSSVIGMIGAGIQAETQLLAINEILTGIKEVKIFDQRREASLKYAEEMGAKLNINVRSVETIKEATSADVVVTSTPSRQPIIAKQDISPGTHIIAIGADAEGKQELDIEILKQANIIVDDITQASHSGEINVPLSQGLIKPEDIYGTLGEVVAGRKKGRESDEDITIFDSTGLAIQDILCAKFVYEKAKS